MIRGPTGLQEFRTLRSRTHEGTGLANTDCFHNGSYLLQSIVHHHQELAEEAGATDVLTSIVLKFINERMLVEELHRKDPHNIWIAASHLPGEAKTKRSLTTGSSSRTSYRPSRHRPLISSPDPRRGPSSQGSATHPAPHQFRHGSNQGTISNMIHSPVDFVRPTLPEHICKPSCEEPMEEDPPDPPAQTQQMSSLRSSRAWNQNSPGLPSYVSCPNLDGGSSLQYAAYEISRWHAGQAPGYLFEDQPSLPNNEMGESSGSCHIQANQEQPSLSDEAHIVGNILPEPITQEPQSVQDLSSYPRLSQGNQAPASSPVTPQDKSSSKNQEPPPYWSVDYLSELRNNRETLENIEELADRDFVSIASSPMTSS